MAGVKWFAYCRIQRDYAVAHFKFVGECATRLGEQRIAAPPSLRMPSQAPHSGRFWVEISLSEFEAPGLVAVYRSVAANSGGRFAGALAGLMGIDSIPC